MHRILIADDHPAIRATLVGVIENTDDLVLVGQAADGAEALKQANETSASLLLLDMQLPRLHGIEVLRALANERSLKILPYSGFADTELVLKALECGAAGYVLKSEPLYLVLDAIRSVLKGGSWISQAALACFAQGGDKGGTPGDGSLQLNHRRRSILIRVAQGHTDKEISEMENLASVTIRNYVLGMVSDLSLRGRPDLVAWAWRNGFGTKGF